MDQPRERLMPLPSHTNSERNGWTYDPPEFVSSPTRASSKIRTMGYANLMCPVCGPAGWLHPEGTKMYGCAICSGLFEADEVDNSPETREAREQAARGETPTRE